MTIHWNTQKSFEREKSTFSQIEKSTQKFSTSLSFIRTILIYTFFSYVKMLESENGIDFMCNHLPLMCQSNI